MRYHLHTSCQVLAGGKFSLLMVGGNTFGILLEMIRFLHGSSL
jgi:hypothetical protein